MSIQLEDLVARVRLDSTGVDTGLAAAQDSIGRAGRTLSSAGRRMSLGITAPLAGIAAAGVSMAADFDLTMRQVAIATGGPVGALKDLAIQMGQETAFSAADASQAMLELAKGGMTAAQIQGGALEQTMRLASAGGVDLASASTFVSNTMQTFGLRTKDASKITTALAGAANASSASVESLGQGLAQGALAARNAGLNLQETTGALALFDAAGLKGSDAGTSLKAAMNSLIPTTTKAKAAMRDANLDFVDAHGNFVDLSDMAKQLHDNLGPLSQAQRQQALETIFGSDGMRAATILMNAGAKGVQEYTKASRDQKTTQELANAAMEGLSGSIERAKGSLETAALIIGQVLAPYVEKAAGFVEQAANAFGNLPGPIQGAVVAGGALLAVIGPLLIGLGFIVTAVGAIGLPVIAVVAGLGLLVGALVTAYNTSSTFRDTVQAAFTQVLAVWQTTVLPGLVQVGAAFQGLLAVVLPIVHQIVGVVQSQMPQIRVTVQQVFNSVKSIISSAMSIVTSVVRIATKVLSAVWGAAGDNILAIIRIAFTTIQGVIRGAFLIIEGLFRTAAAILKGDWSGAWDGIKQVLEGAWTIISSLVSGGLRALWEAVKGGLKLVKLEFEHLPGQITTVLAGLAGILIAAGADMIRGLISGIKSMAGAAADAALDVVKGALDGAKSFLHIGSPSKTFRDEVGKQIGAGLIQGIVGTKDQVRDAMRDLIEAVKKSGRDGLIDLVSDANGRLLKLAGKYEDVTARMERVKDRLKNLREEAASLAAQVKDTIVATADISGLTGARDEEGNVLPVTFQQILEAKTAAAQQAAAFQQVIGQLRSLGLSEDQVQALIAKGPEALEVAQAMASAGAEGIAQLNELQRQVVAVGTKVGADASAAMYDSGIKAAEGLVEGLKNREDAIAKQMRKIARILVRELKDALDIHSPSGVLRDLGFQGGRGLELGLGDNLRAVVKAAQALGSAAIPTIQAPYVPPVPAGFGGTPAAFPSIRVFIGDTELTDIVRTEVGGTLAPLTVLTRQGGV